MNVILTISAVLFIIIISKIFPPKKREGKPSETIEPVERKEPTSRTATFRIAGISHHCRRGDIGVISGEMIDEPTNPYDKDAVMIVDANKTQLLGYIARDEKRSYRKIADGKARMPFVGFIEQYENEDGEMRLFGIVRTYAGDEETVTADAQCDWEYLQHAFTVRDYEKRMELLDSFKY